LNGRNLAAFKHNAGMKIVLVAKANHLVSEAVVFLQQNEFFRTQIVRENMPPLGKGMPGIPASKFNRKPCARRHPSWRHDIPKYDCEIIVDSCIFLITLK
jgi:hypothetical protein